MYLFYWKFFEIIENLTQKGVTAVHLTDPYLIRLWAYALASPSVLVNLVVSLHLLLVTVWVLGYIFFYSETAAGFLVPVFYLSQVQISRLDFCV